MKRVLENKATNWTAIAGLVVTAALSHWDRKDDDRDAKEQGNANAAAIARIQIEREADYQVHLVKEQVQNDKIENCLDAIEELDDAFDHMANGRDFLATKSAEAAVKKAKKKATGTPAATRVRKKIEDVYEQMHLKKR